MTTDELRERVLEIKKRLPNGYMAALCEKFPRRYNTEQKKARVRKVVALQLVNEGIIKDLKEIAL